MSQVSSMCYFQADLPLKTLDTGYRHQSRFAYPALLDEIRKEKNKHTEYLTPFLKEKSHIGEVKDLVQLED